jgi:hypothetical protein
MSWRSQVAPGRLRSAGAAFVVAWLFLAVPVSGANLLPNSGFEVTTAEALPDYWGPAVAWGCSTDQWVTNMDAWRARWGVDRTMRHSGTNSLRIVGATTPPGTADLQAVANWATANAGTYTLSVWLRSDQPNLPVTLQVAGCTPTANTSIATPAAANTWQRYSLTVSPTGFSDTVSCLIYPTGNGTLWVDDVQLQTGGTATTWQPASADATMAVQTVHKVVNPLADWGAVPGENNDTSSVDGSGRFLVNGQPFIPMAAGWWSSVGMGLPSSAAMQDMARAGFNAVVPIVGGGVPLSDISTFLQDAKNNGLKVILLAASNVTTNTLQTWINALKTNSPVIMWYVYDEPRSSAQWQYANAMYNVAKTQDPSRAAMVNVTYLPEDISINYASDVLSMDYYPIGVGGNQSVSISSVGDKVETQHQVALSVGKPNWYWPQSMGYAYFSSREPTGAEAEGMAYLALIHGSRGLMYWNNKPRTLEQWNELRQLNSEVQTLTPVLYSTNPAPAVTVTPATVNVLGKTYGGGKYFVAVNTQPGAAGATLTISDTNATQAAVLFENRSVAVLGGKIVDTFAGFQRHVYALGQLPPVANPDSVIRGRGDAYLNLSITNLLANDRSANGFTVTLSGVDAASANGVTLTTNAGYIQYNGVVAGNDSFHYSISDGHGGAASALVFITATNRLDSITLANPSFESGYDPNSLAHVGVIPGWTNWSQSWGPSGINQQKSPEWGPFADNGIIPDGSYVAYMRHEGFMAQPTAGYQVGETYWLQFFANSYSGADAPYLSAWEAASTAGTNALISGMSIVWVGDGEPFYFINVPFTAAATTGELKIGTLPLNIGTDAILLLDGFSIIRRSSNDVVIVNPSFEASGTSNNYSIYGYKEALAGWTPYTGYSLVQQANFVYANNGTIPDGLNVLGLNEGTSASQDLHGLVPGTAYQLSVYVNASTLTSTNNPLAVFQMDSTTIGSTIVTPVGGSNPYTQLIYTFTAAAADQTLTLLNSANLGGSTLLVDNVRVVTGITFPPTISYGVSGSTLSLTWPEPYLSWYAQSNAVSVANPSAWYDIPGSQTATSLTISTGTAIPNVFYRLRKP